MLVTSPMMPMMMIKFTPYTILIVEGLFTFFFEFEVLSFRVVAVLSL